METEPRFVIDTNILLVSISSNSQYHWIFQGIIHQKFELAITTEILSEKYSQSVAQNVIRTLLLLPNVIPITIYYNWNLIANDEDDDKFVDCAIASNADAIVTNDKHFNLLKTTPFPQVTVLNIDDFKSVPSLIA